METATQEIIYQGLMMMAGVVIPAIGFYVRKYIVTKIDFEKYGFEVDRVERILANAVNYAESVAAQKAKDGSVRLAGSQKLASAKRYIDRVDPAIIRKYSGQIEDMIDRKVVQEFGKNQ